MHPKKVKSPGRGDPHASSTVIAGQNYSARELRVVAELMNRQAAEFVVRGIFKRKLRSPLAQVNKQIARIEAMAHKVGR